MRRRRRHAPVAACAPRESSPVWRRVLTVPSMPEAVRTARYDATAALSEYRLDPDSAFGGAVLLVVSELVANAVRHAADRSPTVDVTLAVGAGQLVVGVADADPRLPDLSPHMMGRGLRTVADLARAYDGALSAEPAVRGCGKVVLVRFVIPDAVGPF